MNWHVLGVGAFTGALVALGRDLYAWQQWRKAQPGLPYDYALACASLLYGAVTGAATAVGISVGVGQ